MENTMHHSQHKHNKYTAHKQMYVNQKGIPVNGLKFLINQRTHQSTLICTIPSTHCSTANEYLNTCITKVCLQCFDAVGWAAGRASGL